MIEGIKEIGDIIISEAPEKFLESLSLNIRSERKGTKQHIVIIEFDTTKGTINFDVQEIKEETPKKYLWVDIAKRRKPQIYLTTAKNKKFTYLFTKTLREIIKYRMPSDKEVIDFQEITKKIFVDFFDNKTGYVNARKFTHNGRNLAEIIARWLTRDFERVEREIKLVKSKNEKKDILKKLFGKNSNCKSYLPDKAFKQLKENTEQLARKDFTANPLFILQQENLMDSISEKFNSDIVKMAKSKNLDESKLSFLEAICEENSLKYEDIELVSFSVSNSDYNGALIEYPGYRRLLEYEKIEQIFNVRHESEGYRKKIFEGVCSLCNKETRVSSNTTNLRLKFYMTDKVGFSSGLRGDFVGNYALCKSCYQKVMAGEVFIENNLQSRIEDIPFYIIPEFTFPVNLSANELKKWGQYVKLSFNSTVNLKGLTEFRDEIDDYPECDASKNNAILNLLFYQKGRDFRVLNLIKDVPPSRLDIIREKAGDVKSKGDRLLGEKWYWYLGLGRIYYLMPVRMQKGNPVEYKKILQSYDALLTGKPMSYKFFIDQFVELAQVYRFNKFSTYNIGRLLEKRYGKPLERITEQEKRSYGENELPYAILCANLLLLYLRELNLLEGGETMNIGELDLKPLMEEYIKEMGYSECQTVLFLLGYLIGEIGNAQWSKDNPTKPILNKITYQGMTTEKLRRLTNDVFEKLKQYKSGNKPLLAFNEPIFAEYKRLLDRNIKNWHLSDQENVFYTLSGYAYAAHERIRKGEKKPEPSSSYSFLEMAGKYEGKAKDVSENKYKYLGETHYGE